MDRLRKAKRLTKAQGGRCGICGRTLVYWKATLDHVHPKSRGGTYAYGNILAVHEECNTMKGARPPTEKEVEMLHLVSGRLGYAPLVTPSPHV